MKKKLSIVLMLCIVLCNDTILINQFNFKAENNNENDIFLNLDKSINQFIIQNHIPTLASSIIYKKNIIWSKAYGEQNNVSFAFKIGSITKTFTTVALMQLNEQGKFELDDDVNDYLPFSMRNPYYPDIPITFRMLLLHQSSLLRGDDTYYHHVLNEFEQKMGYTNVTLNNFPIWVKELITSEDPVIIDEVWGDWAPGFKQNSLRYSNFGFDVLAYLVEILSNKTIDNYFESEIFSKLDMKMTHYSFQDYDNGSVVYPYEWMPVNKRVGPYIWGDWPETDQNENYRFPFFNLDSPGAGGLLSTISDLSNFLMAHMNSGKYKNKQILTKDSINLIHNDSQVSYGNQIIETYGFGWINGKINTFEIDNETFTHFLQGHSGREFGFNSLMFFNQESNIGVIVLVNQGYNFVYDYPLWDIFKVIYQLGVKYSNTQSSNIYSFSFFYISTLFILLAILRRKKII